MYQGIDPFAQRCLRRHHNRLLSTNRTPRPGTIKIVHASPKCGDITL
jgi:hypothetical protein